MEDERPLRKKRSGRRAGPTSSHDVILEAARDEFSARGFEGTTMRAIAQAASVDAALIHHFFLSKGGLFTAAVQDVFTVPDLLETVLTGPEELTGERLARAYVTHWEDPANRPKLVALLRSATAFDGATSVLRDFLSAVLHPVAAGTGQGRPDLRAALCGAYLLGAAAARYVSATGPVAALSPDDLVASLAGTCHYYLCERL